MLATLYLDPESSAVQEHAERLAKIAAWIRNLGHDKWILGCDWNRHPHAVASGGLPGVLDAQVVRPDEPTCYPSVGEPSILDFFLSAEESRGS